METEITPVLKQKSLHRTRSSQSKKKYDVNSLKIEKRVDEGLDFAESRSMNKSRNTLLGDPRFPTKIEIVPLKTPVVLKKNKKPISKTPDARIIRMELTTSGEDAVVNGNNVSDLVSTTKTHMNEEEHHVTIVAESGDDRTDKGDKMSDENKSTSYSFNKNEQTSKSKPEAEEKDDFKPKSILVRHVQEPPIIPLFEDYAYDDIQQKTLKKVKKKTKFKKVKRFKKSKKSHLDLVNEKNEDKDKEENHNDEIEKDPDIQPNIESSSNTPEMVPRTKSEPAISNSESLSQKRKPKKKKKIVKHKKSHHSSKGSRKSDISEGSSSNTSKPKDFDNEQYDDSSLANSSASKKKTASMPSSGDPINCSDNIYNSEELIPPTKEDLISDSDNDFIVGHLGIIDEDNFIPEKLFNPRKKGDEIAKQTGPELTALPEITQATLEENQTTFFGNYMPIFGKGQAYNDMLRRGINPNRPINSFYSLQVPIIPSPDDSILENEAAAEFNLTALINAARS